MKLLGVDHIDIVVSDLSASLEFYRKFGMSPEGTLDNGQTVFLWNGDDDRPVRIELHQAEPKELRDRYGRTAPGQPPGDSRTTATPSATKKARRSAAVSKLGFCGGSGYKREK